MKVNYIVCIIGVSLSALISTGEASWDNWWTYDGISGPDFWGLLNPKWSHCSQGRKQSPIDIDTNRLLYDPGLKPYELAGSDVDGRLENTGRGIRFNVNHNSSGSQTIRAGPFAYEYRLDHLILHFGREDDRGSEHTINGQRFAGELQAFFYNSLLYENYTEAEHQPNGLAAIAVLLQLDRGNSAPNRSTLELSELLGQMEQIKHKGSRSNATCRLNLARLLPTSPFYLTYEGSLTEPPCSESTIWIVLNRPLRITSRQLHSLRHSVVIDGYGDNFRPSQALIGRCIRTNIVNQSTLAEQNAATLELAKQRVEQEAAITTITANEVLDSSATAKNASSSVAIGAVKSFCSNGNRIGFYAYKANVKQ